jgi:hypothetical protein
VQQMHQCSRCTGVVQEMHGIVQEVHPNQE